MTLPLTDIIEISQELGQRDVTPSVIKIIEHDREINYISLPKEYYKAYLRGIYKNE